ncbi:MAG: phosphotransferase [Proteobacteria bacterium]|nr:phosphotransferase [Pseudomonadota bacterium]
MSDDFTKRLRSVVKNHVPDCTDLISVDRLSGGASQETYRLKVDTTHGPQLLAMRRAPGGLHNEPVVGHPGLAAEALLMRAAAAAGVPEPQVHYVLEVADGLGDGFIMQWLEGEALGARIVKSPDLAGVRENLAFECGQILARIHAIDLSDSGLDKVLSPQPPSDYVEQTWERYRAFNTPQPMIDYVGRWLKDNLPQTAEQKLVHNDFRNGNVMVSTEGVVAVLDWEVAHIGDPMRDLGWICTNSWRFGRSDLPVGGFGRYEDLFAGYESVSGEAVNPQRVKFWEVFGSFWWAVGCLGMAEHYRSGPDKTVERPGIGRRSSECQVDCANLLIPGPVQLVEGLDLTASDEMPRLDELLISVRDYLRNDVMAATQGRLNFMSRVAANSLDIVLRDLASGERHRDAETARLRTLLNAPDASLSDLRWRLVKGLRGGEIALSDVDLQTHLRTTVVNQLAIDQPVYSGLKNALSFNAA